MLFFKGWEGGGEMAEILSFDRLVENVGNVHNNTSGAAKGAVNQLLKLRTVQIVNISADLRDFAQT